MLTCLHSATPFPYPTQCHVAKRAALTVPVSSLVPYILHLHLFPASPDTHVHMHCATLQLPATFNTHPQPGERFPCDLALAYLLLQANDVYPPPATDALLGSSDEWLRHCCLPI